MRKKRPNYLHADDAPMICGMIDIFKACDGLSPSEVELRLDSLRKGTKSDARQSYLKKTLLSRCAPKVEADQIKPMQLRADFYTQWFSQAEFPRQLEALWESFATNRGLPDVLQLRKAMFSDVEEKIDSSALDADKDLSGIITDTNLLMIYSHLRYALTVRICLEGNARAVVRLARFRGLFCFVTTDEDDNFYLDISGAMALFKKTSRYANTLMEIVRLLCWTDDFILEAYCERKEKRHTLVIKSKDPIKPARRPKTFDSKVEERFAREFIKKCPDWDLVREPDAIDTKVGVMFPDFLLRHKFKPQKRFYCEIIGYWTPEYLRKKLAQWSSVGDCDYVLCVDEKLKLEDESLTDIVASRIIFYSGGKIDPLLVIKTFEKDKNVACAITSINSSPRPRSNLTN